MEVRRISDILFISDLDGTLLDPAGRVTENTARLINGLIGQGMDFTFATARSVYSAVPLTSALNITQPCVLMNGVSIYDLGRGSYIKNEFIPEESSAEVIRIFEEAGVRCFMYRIHREVLTCYYTEITPGVMSSFAEERKNRYGKPFVQCSSLLSAADSETVYYTTTGEYDTLRPAADLITEVPGVSHAFYQDTYTGKWYLEVFSERASKYNAVKYLKELGGFHRTAVLGDNLNDLPMFRAADITVAVGNARPEVKAAADYTALTNAEDGAAEWLLQNYIKVKNRKEL